ncbi:methyltransferase [Mycobacterium sp.]|uniref:methyltransferase n=1 Tax=Mycobacterium sp. TaxID=1785 RepID=UPI0033423142
MLKHIVHDWDESKVKQILRNVRAAMATNTKLLVLEAVVPVDDREHLSTILDLEMLVVGAGRERTAAEYTDLLRATGFRNTRVNRRSAPRRSWSPKRPSPISRQAGTPRVAVTHGVPDVEPTGGRAWPEPCARSSWRRSSWRRPCEPAPS